VRKKTATATTAAINERLVSPSRIPERATSCWTNVVGCIPWLPALAVENGDYTVSHAARLPQRGTT
jgi:hypothetical protein